MLMLLTAIINQKTLQPPRRYVKWETVLKVSDYQNVINIVYLGILGIEKEISEECEEQFFQSYKKELLLRDSYSNAEEVIMWQLERYGIEALILSDTRVEGLYPKPEMANLGRLEILVNKMSLPQIHRLMRDMDYGEVENRMGTGALYERIPGIRVMFYDEMPVHNKAYKKYFSASLKKYPCLENYHYIHTLSAEDGYLYQVGKMVEFYLAGDLRIRDVLDFWQYQRAAEDVVQSKKVKDFFQRVKWQEFVHQMGLLATLWFGDGAARQYGVALELEEYILSSGRENKRLDQRLLPYEKSRLDFYWRNRDAEWAVKKREWLFPSREYMYRFFPVLNQYPFLLFFCWAIRWLRFLKQFAANRWRKVWCGISVRFLDIKEKMKGLIRKREENLSEKILQNREEEIRDVEGNLQEREEEIQEREEEIQEREKKFRNRWEGPRDRGEKPRNRWEEVQDQEEESQERWGEARDQEEESQDQWEYAQDYEEEPQTIEI
ncbi:MAG TPA: hypothetical protein DF613_07365 [Lachnospiraceae bacterium]|nr:hypothetical protein [Lachnospiraceae bacterium]